MSTFIAWVGTSQIYTTSSWTTFHTRKPVSEYVESDINLFKELRNYAILDAPGLEVCIHPCWPWGFLTFLRAFFNWTHLTTACQPRDLPPSVKEAWNKRLSGFKAKKPTFNGSPTSAFG